MNLIVLQNPDGDIVGVYGSLKKAANNSPVNYTYLRSVDKVNSQRMVKGWVFTYCVKNE